MEIKDLPSLEVRESEAAHPARRSTRISLKSAKMENRLQSPSGSGIEPALGHFPTGWAGVG